MRVRGAPTDDKAHRYLASFSITTGLSEDLIRALAVCATLKPFKRGEIIFQAEHPATAAYVVVRGTLKAYVVANSGRVKTLAILIEGDTWNEEALVETGLHECTCQALEDGALYRLERFAFEELIGRRPEITLAFLKTAVRRMKRAQTEVRELSFHDADARLARTLVDLASRRGQAGLDGVMIDLPLSHQEIADLIGVRREAVTRGLVRFRSADIIKCQGRKIILRDPAALQDIALGVGS